MNPPGAASERHPPERRSELDAIRALLVVGLVFFHAALVFDTGDDFYVKNAETTEGTTIAAGFVVVWAMPLLFLIAGLGAWHSVRRRGPGRFAVERLRRLGVPLVFATVTLVPLPQWLRHRSQPDSDQSYLEFWRGFFHVRLDLSDFPFVLDGEHFETGHLWFVVLLLLFSLVLAGGIGRLPRVLARRARDRLADAVRRRGMVLVPAVPIAVVSALLGLEEAFAGWSRWAYLLFFLGGFVLAADPRFRAAARRDAALAGAAGAVCFLAGMPLFLLAGVADGGTVFTDLSPIAIVARALYGATGWCWVLAITGLLDRRSAAAAAGPDTGGARSRLAGYLGPAVLPLYVLHQPIVVVVAYGVVGWSAPPLVKYAAIVVASLVLTVGAYELLVRRSGVTRFLFGMREPVRVGAAPARPPALPPI